MQEYKTLTPEQFKMALAGAARAEMKSATAAPPANGSGGQRQLQPGDYFRWPGRGAAPRFVQEGGPCAPGTTLTLSQQAATNAGFQKFQTLDIDKGFLLQLTFTTTWTEGEDETLTLSPFSLASWIQELQIQFESAYSTYRLPGPLAIIFQLYRGQFAPLSVYSSQVQAGSNPNSSAQFAAGWETGASILGTPNLALNVTGTPQTYNMFIEVPVCQYFDLYWELSARGQAVGPPIPRALVSPQRMAATTRNVTPKMSYAAGLSSQPTNFLQSGPVSKASGDTSSTFSGTVEETWYRDCWIPSQSPIAEPPGRMWQYSRDYIAWQTAGGAVIPVTLDDEVPGQGQILSLFFFTYDPALNDGIGGVTPYASYLTVELLYGSQVQLRQETPAANQYVWAQKHGTVLPTGVMGWDLALTADGKLTNENAINTLVTNGTQLRVTYGSSPSATSTIYVGLEMLKKVGS